jgi:hypothetical protein
MINFYLLLWKYPEFLIKFLFIITLSLLIAIIAIIAIIFIISNMTLIISPPTIPYLHSIPPPYEVAVNLHLWGTNNPNAKNTLFKIGDKVRINLFYLCGFPPECYHNQIPEDRMQKLYARAQLVGKVFTISRIGNGGTYDYIDLVEDEVYSLAFSPNWLDKVF